MDLPGGNSSPASRRLYRPFAPGCQPLQVLRAFNLWRESFKLSPGPLTLDEETE